MNLRATSASIPWLHGSIVKISHHPG